MYKNLKEYPNYKYNLYIFSIFQNHQLMEEYVFFLFVNLYYDSI